MKRNENIMEVNGRDVIIQACCNESDGSLYANVGISNGEQSIFARRTKYRPCTFRTDGSVTYPYLCDEKSHDKADITPEEYEAFISENYDTILEFVRSLV